MELTRPGLLSSLKLNKNRLLEILYNKKDYTGISNRSLSNKIFYILLNNNALLLMYDTPENRAILMNYTEIEYDEVFDSVNKLKFVGGSDDNLITAYAGNGDYNTTEEAHLFIFLNTIPEDNTITNPILTTKIDNNSICKTDKTYDDIGKVKDTTQYYDLKNSIAIINENDEIKRTYHVEVLESEIYSLFTSVSGILISYGTINLKDKFKNGSLSYPNGTVPIITEFFDFRSLSNQEYVLISNVNLSLYKAITFAFAFKCLDDTTKEPLYNYGNSIQFYKENDKIYLAFNETDIIEIDSFHLNEYTMIAVSFDLDNNKMYKYKNVLEEQIGVIPLQLSLAEFTPFTYEYPLTIKNNQIEIGHNLDGTIYNHSLVSSFYISDKLHIKEADFERLHHGVQPIEYIPDFDNLPLDEDADDQVLGITKDNHVVKLKTSSEDLENIYNSFNVLPGYSTVDEKLKLSLIWKDGVINYPVENIEVNADSLLDFTNNTNKKYISISSLPLINYAIKTIGFRLRPLDDTTKEALFSYGTLSNRIELYKDQDYAVLNLIRNNVSYEININLSVSSAKKPLFWYNFFHNLGNPNLGENTVDASITDRIGGNLDTSNRILSLGKNNTCSFARGIRQINSTAPKKLTWCVWIRRDSSGTGNFNADISLRSTFNWRRFMIDSNFSKIWLKNENLSANYSFSTSVPAIAASAVPVIWIYVAISYNGDDGTLNFIMKDDSLTTYNHEQTFTLSGSQQTTFNNGFFNNNDAGVLELELTKCSTALHIEDARIFNDYLTIQELNDTYDDRRVVNLGEISSLQVNKDNLVAISLDTDNNKVYHYVNENVFNTSHVDLAGKIPDFTIIDDTIEIGRLVSDNNIVNGSYLGGLSVFYEVCKTSEEFGILSEGYVKIKKLLDLNNITQNLNPVNNVLVIDSSNNVHKTDKTYADISGLSDNQLKTDVAPLTSSLSKILELNPVSFRWKEHRTMQKKNIGLIAQEVKEIIPEIVNKYNDYMSINYQSIIPVLIQAVQEQNQMIKELQKKINE